MGGNVQIDGHKPQPFTLAERLEARDDIMSFLLLLSAASEDKVSLFGPDEIALHNNTAFSGSSKHYMNVDISSYDLVAKRTYGDIDVIVPPEAEPVLADIFRTCLIAGPFNIIGYKKIASSFSVLVMHRKQQVVRQIDFEFKPYDAVTGCPTEFAQWSQSVALEDLQAGIKGTLHKHLIASCLHADEHLAFVQHNNGVQKTYVRDYTFAQTHGIRRKHTVITRGNAEELDVYVEVTSKDQPKYITDMVTIGVIIFPCFVTRFTESYTRREALESFLSLSKAIRDQYTYGQRDRVCKAFVSRLFDHKAMSPLDYNQQQDSLLKMDAIRRLFEIAPPTADLTEFIEDRKRTYYESWRTR